MAETRPPQPQRLLTPHREGGVDLEPQRSPRRVILNHIQRTWATLWGWTGSEKRLLQCDRFGALQTRGPDMYRTRQVLVTVPSGSGSRTFDFTETVDHVAYYGHDGPVFADFSVDEVTFYGRRGSVGQAFDIATLSVYNTLELWTTCRYVRMQAEGFMSTTYTGQLVGSVLIR